jgi:glycine hydroxymethyltransferase
MHVIASKAVCFKEALSDDFKTYAQTVAANAQALAKELLAQGFALVSGGTDNHLMLVDVSVLGLTGKAVEQALDKAGISVNKNAIPFDKQKPMVTSGIRIGTPSVTTRGMKETEMRQIGSMIARLIEEGEAAVPTVREQAIALCKAFPLYPEID